LRIQVFTLVTFCLALHESNTTYHPLSLSINALSPCLPSSLSTSSLLLRCRSEITEMNTSIGAVCDGADGGAVICLHVSKCGGGRSSCLGPQDFLDSSIGFCRKLTMLTLEIVLIVFCHILLSLGPGHLRSTELLRQKSSKKSDPLGLKSLLVSSLQYGLRIDKRTNRF
jgi:hypothetical protein